MPAATMLLAALSMTSRLTSFVTQVERLSFQLDRERETLLRRVRQRVAEQSDPLMRLPPERHAISKNHSIVITGGTEGLGREAAAYLARAGYATIICARDQNRGVSAVDYIKEQAGQDSRVVAVDLDLSNFGSVERGCSAIVAAADVLGAPPGGLLLNAGVWPSERQLTSDGLELGMQINHASHFALTALLLPSLVAGARIVTTASSAHALTDSLDLDRLVLPESESWNSPTAYAESKLANVLFARSLAKRHPPSRLTSLAVHPGAVATSLFRDFAPPGALPLPPGGMGGPPIDATLAAFQDALLDNPALSLVLKKPEDGCRTLVYGLLADDLPTGSYLSDMELTDVAPAAKDARAADALWTWSEEWVSHMSAASEGTRR